MSLRTDEKEYITERFVKWKPGGFFRFWESKPENDPADKDTPALVMIHGYGAVLEQWRYAFADFKGQYRLYALDLLGFGGSAKPNGRQVEYSAELWARQIYDFAKYKGEKKIFIAGNSLGGMVGLEFARNYPEMLAGLILIDTAGLPDQGKLEQETARKNSRFRGKLDLGMLTFSMIQAPIVGETLARLVTLPPNDWAIRKSLENAYYDQRKVTPELIKDFITPLRSPGAADSYLAVTRSFTRFQLDLKPGDIKGPVSIIWGEFDRSMPPGVMIPRWKKLIPQAETFVVRNSGHCPMHESPEQVNPRMFDFMERVVAGEWQPAKRKAERQKIEV
jgi:pimeloyl-ACP methyl ester carboxylesterase